MKKGRREKTPFASIEEAVAAIRDGRMIIVVDDEDRENEGDLTIAASTCRSSPSRGSIRTCGS